MTIQKAWHRIHLLEWMAVFLLLCTAAFYAKAYLDFESNYLTWLENPANGEGMSRAEALGLSGDFLGGVLNPILSFFSFIALLFTLRLQRRELTATMEELKKSTIAAESNVRLFTEQLHAQRLDAFENTFFALLKIHNATFETINAHREAEGSQPAGSVLQQWMGVARSQDTLEQARAVLMADHSEIDHFISLLFEMLKFIDLKFPSEALEERTFYADILKAIINQDAFEAIAMYAATNDQASPYYRFKQLIEKYTLLEELDLRAPQRQKFAPGYAQFFQPLPYSAM
jgi:hypothetical protein